MIGCDKTSKCDYMSTDLADEEQVDSREFELNNEEKRRKIQVFNALKLVLETIITT